MKIFTEITRYKIIVLYTILFYLLSIFKYFQGLFLFQFHPFVFKTRFDGTSWYFMQTGLHQWLIANPSFYCVADVLFYSIPLVYFIFYKWKRIYIKHVGIFMLLINWFYVELYVLYPTNSIECHIGWLLFPFLFMMNDLKSFWFLLSGLRYYVLFFWSSAGLWKLYGGGIFHFNQMSNILLLQHKDLLVTSVSNNYTKFIIFIISNPYISWSLLAGATIIELSFLVGFFTKKFDTFLLFFALLFIAMDKLIMNMYYFEILPLMIPLIYSKFKEPSNNKI